MQPGLAPGLSHAKYAALFAREAREQLRAARAAVETIAKEATASNAVDVVFRAVHTIKGMAASMGYAAVEEVAHALEDALAGLRDTTPDRWTAAVGALTAGVDLLDDAVESTVDPGRASCDAPGVRAVVVRLTAAVASTPVEREDPVATKHRTQPVVVARTLRVEVSALDRLLDLAGEMTALRTRLAHAASRTGDVSLARAVADLGRVAGAFSDEVHAARLVDLAELLAELPRVVRQAAQATGKQVRLTTSGGDVVADRAVVDALAEPLIHLLRNAVDHGIERPEVRVQLGKPREGDVSVRVVRDGNALLVHVEDDGGGVDRVAVVARARSRGQLAAVHDPDGAGTVDDATLLECLALPGLTTSDAVGRVSGRGVGVDAALARVRALGGALALDTRAGQGTRFTLRMPLSWAVVPALLVRADGAAYAIPLAHVRGTRERAASDAVVPTLAALIDPRHVADPTPAATDVILLAPAAGAPGIEVAVDVVLGARDCVLKPVGVPRGAFRITAGATILEGGEVALVLDIPAVAGRSAAPALAA